MPWLNIDIPTKSATVHDDTCRHMGDRLKNVEDGGWQRYNTVAEALAAASKSGYHAKECGHCLRK